MSFSRKYITWLLLPPAIVLGPLAFLFLTQTVRMSLATAGSILGLFALFFVAGSAVLWKGLAPLAETVDEFLNGDRSRGRDC